MLCILIDFISFARQLPSTIRLGKVCLIERQHRRIGQAGIARSDERETSNAKREKQLHRSISRRTLVRVRLKRLNNYYDENKRASALCCCSSVRPPRASAVPSDQPHSLRSKANCVRTRKSRNQFVDDRISAERK